MMNPLFKYERVIFEFLISVSTSILLKFHKTLKRNNKITDIENDIIPS